MRKTVLGGLNVLLLSLCLTLSAQAQSPVWQSRGPYGGSVLSLAASPGTAPAALILAGTDGGGLFASRDAAQSWQRAEGLPVDLAVSSVAVSPRYDDEKAIFVASRGSGVLRSGDGGETWATRSDGLTTRSVNDLALSPTFDSDQIALAATDRGFFRSQNAGKLWAPVGPVISALSVAIGPAGSGDAGRLAAFGGTVVGLYRSTNSGLTWAPTSLSGRPITDIAISPNYGNDRAVAMGTVAGVFLSRNGGDTWGGPWLENQELHTVLFSPRYAADGMLYAGSGQGIYASGGDHTRWTSVGTPDAPVRALLGLPTGAASFALLAGTDQAGVVASANGGLTWVEANSGLLGRALNTVAISPDYLRDRAVFAGGRGGLWRSADDGQSWSRRPFPSADVSAIGFSADYARDGTVYAASSGGVFVSRTKGHAWYPTAGALPVLRLVNLAVGMGRELWAATSEGGIYYSPDGGGRWEPRSQGLGSPHVTAVEWLGGAGDSARLLATTWGMGIYRSMDGGRAWQAVAVGPDTPHVRDVRSATGYGGRLWSFAGTTAGVYRSGDEGLNWDFSSLLGLDIASIALHPNYAARPNCYVGTARDGLLYSNNGGLSWLPLNEGLGDLRLNRVAVALDDASQPVIYAATQAGVWRYGGAPGQPIITLPDKDLHLPLVAR
ncbi:MAG: hypothetical protein V1772_11285 [Chloroflexota bacterium]